MRQVDVSRTQQIFDPARLMGQDSVASAPPPPPDFAPLDHVVLTDGVARTLFDGFAEHLRGDRSDQETGWLLIGLRLQRQAVVLAALPAGHRRQASRTHVRFNATAQALGSRILRQHDRRLTILGVAHTHPGSLRRPSNGDLRGDRAWVRQLRGGEGVFAIGTADGAASARPRVNAQCRAGLRFSWYGLRQGEGRYRPLPVEATRGADLAHELQRVWRTVEEHAERLERLLCEQAAARIEVAADGLSVTLPLAEEGARLRAVLCGPDVRYYTERRGELTECHPGDGRVDRGVCLLLAESSGGGGELSR